MWPRPFVSVWCRLLLAVILLSGCSQEQPDHARVRRVIDGDTIELHDGRRVRYLGIDTPEVRRRDGTRLVVDPEPFGKTATAFNRRLVEGQRVRLELDVQTHDRFGRLLAYVYVDGTMVNEELLRAGLAEPMILGPNIRYELQFRALADHARRAAKGMWSGAFEGAN